MKINNKLRIKIPAGGMYQEWDSLMDLLDEDTAAMLEDLANTKGCRKVQICEAINMGFVELANWSVPDLDSLLLIDDNYLVCLHKSDIENIH